MKMRKITGAIAAAVLAGASFNVSAEADQVRFAQQFGLLYLPMHVVVDQKLVEACAADAGLGDVKVSMHRFSGGAAVNQALLSGNVDCGAGGIGPLLIIWDKTKGNLNVRAMSNIAAMPMTWARVRQSCFLSFRSRRQASLTSAVGCRVNARRSRPRYPRASRRNSS